MAQKIQMTEERLHNIVNNSVKRILNEISWDAAHDAVLADADNYHQLNHAYGANINKAAINMESVLETLQAIQEKHEDTQNSKDIKYLGRLIKYANEIQNWLDNYSNRSSKFEQYCDDQIIHNFGQSTQALKKNLLKRYEEYGNEDGLYNDEEFMDSLTPQELKFWNEMV